ncbi:MAG: MOSC domain-containing protein [Xenococcaceae cyanobacterium MO_167.B52]|nr:MOSC domain-containing protein [Xenococcaceae cyanobacterium MO_167.B52]
MIVSELWIYPIKSCQGIKLQQAEVTSKGFLWDREMMVISQKGKFLTQRQFPQLAKVQVLITSDTITLSLQDNSLPPITFTPTLQGKEIEVEIWRDHTIAIDQGNVVADWFHQVLELTPEKRCRLVRQSPQHLRPVNPKIATKPTPVSFADGYPFLLTTTASLAELNRRIAETYQDVELTVSMKRFRPNIVVETSLPFDEDNWRLVQLGNIRFTVAKPCSRCIITTVDQQKGNINKLKEPLRTLGTFRQFGEQGVLFGENMIPQNRGIIRVGDKLQILEVRA